MEVYDWNGLTVTYYIEDLGWEGDPSVPNGINHLGEAIEIKAIYSGKIDIIEYMPEELLEMIEEDIWTYSASLIDRREEEEEV